MGEGPAETMIELGPAYSDTTGIAGNVDMISFVPLIGLRQSPLPKSCADIRSIPMLADDWGVPRCEADERGGVVLACLVERLLRVCGIVVSGRAVADTFFKLFGWNNSFSNDEVR